MKILIKYYKKCQFLLLLFVSLIGYSQFNTLKPINEKKTEEKDAVRRGGTAGSPGGGAGPAEEEAAKLKNGALPFWRLRQVPPPSGGGFGLLLDCGLALLRWQGFQQ